MNKEFSCKVFRNGPDEVLVAIADKDILGKTFKNKDLEIFISKEFYHERFCDEKEALILIKEASIVNVMGKNIIELLLKENILSKELILRPCGVPHAQIFEIK